MPNTTPASIGADAALARLVAAVEAETGPDWDCNSYHPSLWSALDVARAALAAAAQPAPIGADAERAAFDRWRTAELPAGCVSDMERGWMARAALASAEQPTECGNCFEGKSDLDHVCLVCSGTGHVAAAPKAAPAQAGAVYAELPKPDATTVGLGYVWNRHSLRAYADATHALRASRGQAPAPVAVAGPRESVKFMDQSTADPVEKARRYLKAMGDQRRNSSYFFDDGYPRRESAQDAHATLAVLEQLAATPTTQAAPAPAPAAVAVPVKWWNGCDKTVPAALRYLADNERPSGGEERFNCAHLYQLADEIERMARLPLYTAPAPAAQGDALDTDRLDWLTFNLSGKALRDIGVIWSEHSDARRAIDAARAAEEGGKP